VRQLVASQTKGFRCSTALDDCNDYGDPWGRILCRRTERTVAEAKAKFSATIERAMSEGP